MRTTVTLDDDVARLLSDAQHAQRGTFKQVLNDAVRRGLGAAEPPPGPYLHIVHHSGVRPGIDVTALNRLADESDDDPPATHPA